MCSVSTRLMCWAMSPWHSSTWSSVIEIAGSCGVVEEDGQLQDRTGQKGEPGEEDDIGPPGSQKPVQNGQVRMPAVGPVGQGRQHRHDPQ